jgi:hypothetical protein
LNRALAVAAAAVAALCGTPVAAQAPAAPATASAPAQVDELEQLVGRIALYPDDLVGIILPASTNPLQVVQADRFLDARKKDAKTPVDEKWDDSVKALVNYPEVVKMMSQDLDWTAALGEAVVADSAEVMEAIQSFRRKTQSVGNLKSDDKQTVVVEKEVIKIVPADPQVIYVPQYNPTTVVYAGYGWGYYPAPYPVYYYPYPPGAAFAAGVVWGAALGAIWNGGHYNCGWGGGGNNTINIDRNTNINVDRGDRTNVGSGNRQTTQWKSGKQPGQVSSTVGKTPPSQRVGDTRGGGAGGARASTQPGAGGVGDRGGAGAGAGGGTGARPSAQPSGADRAGAGAGARPSAQPSGGGSAFDSRNSSARQTNLDSSRGTASRSSMSSAPSRGGGSYGGGAARGGGGGGGRGGRR